MVFLFAWVRPQAIGKDLAAAGAGMLALALISGIVQYALAFWLYLIGLKRLPVSTAALFLTLTPVFGIGRKGLGNYPRFSAGSSIAGL
ncbi:MULTISPECIES: EamA family transporter [Ensifer]|uniref:EamA family transporter n=1 Tax=Ensifer adhaerens TaxID=106592 RepID=A0ABY8HA61_ENSAD|nr:MULTISPECIES: EamA family transporter [Ensifer]ANK72926.1 hypothetical protein FA04_10000 [Ensifer adhaerens]KDP75234.1 hypothetical protein FA04_03265 [Ensifer adhaerens]KQX32697.1 hypothetical protein ASD01_01770 [Ensifer sp. Root423]KQZ58267.1 hypothetical protein ASD63_01780 [Ensifer sp. Root558]MBD9540278.1 EamA family transporter [Ensifer sp. ENS04]